MPDRAMPRDDVVRRVREYNEAHSAEHAAHRAGSDDLARRQAELRAAEHALEGACMEDGERRIVAVKLDGKLYVPDCEGGILILDGVRDLDSEKE